METCCFWSGCGVLIAKANLLCVLNMYRQYSSELFIDSLKRESEITAISVDFNFLYLAVSSVELRNFSKF